MNSNTNRDVFILPPDVLDIVRAPHLTATELDSLIHIHDLRKYAAFYPRGTIVINFPIHNAEVELAGKTDIFMNMFPESITINDRDMIHTTIPTGIPMEWFSFNDFIDRLVQGCIGTVYLCGREAKVNQLAMNLTYHREYSFKVIVVADICNEEYGNHTIEDIWNAGIEVCNVSELLERQIRVNCQQQTHLHKPRMFSRSKGE